MKKFFSWIKNIFGPLAARKSRPGVYIRRPKRAIQFEPNNTPIDYVFNDMSTPHLIQKINAPPLNDLPKFVVGQYKGGGFRTNQVEFQAANCFVTIANILNLFNNISDKKLTHWATGQPLQIFPRSGKDLNAYYDRHSLNFFWFSHPMVGTIYTADSSEIIAHELGHAILDAFRPDTWGGSSLEVWAMHEAFADFTAIMNSLSHQIILQHVIDQTGGDLRKPNVCSELAEHLALCMGKLMPRSGYTTSLRSANNQFKYVHPGTLPSQATPDRLSTNPHSFGRVFVGALYDILIMMFEDAKSKGHNQIDSLAMARNALGACVLKAMQNAPLNTRFFASVAKTMLWADIILAEKYYHDRMREIFYDRNILEPELNMLADAPACDESRIVKTTGTMNLVLSNHFVRMQSDNPLYDVEVEIPHEQAYLYDQSGQAIDVVWIDNEEAISDAQDAIVYLHETKSVSNSPKTPFEIRDGKLTRTHFSGGQNVV